MEVISNLDSGFDSGEGTDPPERVEDGDHFSLCVSCTSSIPKVNLKEMKCPISILALAGAGPVTEDVSHGPQQGCVEAGESEEKTGENRDKKQAAESEREGR